jgi:hypothetical protein
VRDFIFPQGTRVRVKQGSFPLDRQLVGREGLILHIDPYKPGRYGVLLDGESDTREFAEDELERSS